MSKNVHILHMQIVCVTVSIIFKEHKIESGEFSLLIGFYKRVK